MYVVLKILIVDDSAAMRAIVRRGLEKFGYRTLQIELASGAKEAFEMIGKWQPDILLSDWHMPMMSGLELLQEINRRRLPIKVGFVTTENNQQLVGQAMAEGAKFILNKPFEDAALHKALLPLVQGAEESESMLNHQTGVDHGVALPNARQLQTVLQGMFSAELTFTPVEPLAYSPELLPLLLALFEDPDTRKIRAVGILDLHGTYTLATAKCPSLLAEISGMLADKTVNKAMMDQCQEIMSSVAMTLLDKQTRKSLTLKNLSFVPKTFSKMEQIYAKPQHLRMDGLVHIKGLGQGRLSIVSTQAGRPARRQVS